MSEERKPGRRRWSGVFLALVVLGGGLAISGAAFTVVKAGEDRYAAQTMDRYADDITEAITGRVEGYGATLTDLAYAVGAQSDLSSNDFTRICAGLDTVRLPGATGVAFVVPATSAQAPAVQQYWRGQGAAGLTLKPAPGSTDHDFMIFEKALDNRPDMRGLDLVASPQATAALTTARHSRLLAISPAYHLLRDADLASDAQQSSVLLAVPVYTGLGSTAPDEFAGWVVMGLRGQDFLSRTMLERAQGNVQVSLADPAGPGTVIAAVTPGARIADRTLMRSANITVGQRRWQVTMWPTARLAAAADRGMSMLTLTAGAALSVLLAALIAALAGSRGRALDRVDRATADLRRDIERREEVEARLREREEQLHELAFHDPLTGLANRMLFYDRLSSALRSGDGDPPLSAVLFIDLDGFKQVNDRLGHQAGDTVLQVVADRLRRGLRAQDTVARFGGDEFAIILESLFSPDDARAAAARVIAEVQQPIDLDGQLAAVSASVGIAVNRPGATPDDIIREADEAMYAAKTGGKNRYAESAA